MLFKQFFLKFKWFQLVLKLIHLVSLFVLFMYESRTSRLSSTCHMSLFHVSRLTVHTNYIDIIIPQTYCACVVWKCAFWTEISPSCASTYTRFVILFSFTLPCVVLCGRRHKQQKHLRQLTLNLKQKISTAY